MFICEHCNRESKTSSSHKNHVRRCPQNPNRVVEQLSAEGRSKIANAAKAQNSKQWTPEFRKRHSEAMQRAVQKNPDSYTKNNVSGRTKLIEYNGVKLKGSWEVKVAKWLDSQSIKWETEVNPQPYFWNDKWHMYFPDFFLTDFDSYIEVKGYKTDRDEAKWLQFVGSLVIIDKDVINKLDSYDFVDLLITNKFKAS